MAVMGLNFAKVAAGVAGASALALACYTGLGRIIDTEPQNPSPAESAAAIHLRETIEADWAKQKAEIAKFVKCVRENPFSSCTSPAHNPRSPE